MPIYFYVLALQIFVCTLALHIFMEALVPLVPHQTT